MMAVGRRTQVLSATFLAALIPIARCTFAQSEKKVVAVRTSEIPGTVRLIGPLGTSLGQQTVRIHGRWKEFPKPEKSLDFRFVVDEIDGKKTAPISIPSTYVLPLTNDGMVTVQAKGGRKWVASYRGASDEQPPPMAFDGDEWEMWGFESGLTDAWPLAVRQRYAVQQVDMPGAFVTTFCFVEARMLGKVHEKGEAGGYSLKTRE